MKRTWKYMSASGLAALIALSATSAHANGTPANTTVTNSVTVSYQVGGVDQTDETASDTFLVDRRVNLTVAEVGGAATVVQAGDTSELVTFQVTNLTNDALDIALAATQQTGGTGAHGTTDNFDVTNVKIFVAAGAGASFGSATETTFIDEIAADGIYTVWVQADIPASGLVNNDTATIILTGTAHAAGAATTLGAIYTNSVSNDPAVVDTVLADGNGGVSGDADNDGTYASRDDYIVEAAALSVVKTSEVINDFVSASAPYFHIPGALVEYCIAVSNGSGAATATGLSVSDVIPANMTFVSGSIVLNGTVDGGGACLADGAADTGDTTYDSGSDTITATLNDIAADESRTVIFRATIDN